MLQLDTRRLLATLKGMSPRLLVATLLNARRRRMNRSMIGFSLRETTAVVTREMIESYAAATADPNPAYRGPDPVAPPMMVSRLVMPAMQRLMLHPDLQMNFLRMVHAEQSFSWRAPIRPGARLALALRIADIEDTPAGELLRVTGEIHRGDEKLGDAAVGLIVRSTKRGGPRKKLAEPRSPAYSFELSTTPDQAFRYAEASGDYNFIHTSDLLARLAGLPGAILHGMCVLAMSVAALSSRHKERLICGVSARFAHPTLPGQPLTIVGFEVDNDGSLPFEVRNAAGKAVLKNAALQCR